jgi:hypothetical protein
LIGDCSSAMIPPESLIAGCSKRSRGGILVIVSVKT